MSGWQQAIVVGNVGRDAEMRYTQGGQAVASFSVACTEKWNDRESGERREKTTWFNVSCWGGLADVASQYIEKGMSVMVVGTVTARAWKNQAGEPQASLDMRATSLQLLGANFEYGDEYQGEQEQQPQPTKTDDIPF
jgi:single-strand DNA-binding protein